MQTIGAFDAKTHFSQIIEQVLTGEEFTVTKHGKPVARIVPIVAENAEAPQFDAVKRKKVLAAISSLKASIKQQQGKVTRDDILKWIHEGRKEHDEKIESVVWRKK